MIFGNSIELQSICTIFLIIFCGILFMKLQQNKTTIYEHFPSRMRNSEEIRQKPKLLIPKITNQMLQDTKFKTLPDDYDYLYNYEKNFELNKVYGDYSSRLEAYKVFLMNNKNTFHNLDDKDVDNLVKLLNEGSVREGDIPSDFVYKRDFRAVNL